MMKRNDLVEALAELEKMDVTTLHLAHKFPYLRPVFMTINCTILGLLAHLDADLSDWQDENE